MLGKLSSSLTALGKYRATNKEDRDTVQASCQRVTTAAAVQQLSHFKLAGLAWLGSMYRFPWLSSAQRAAQAGLCRLGSSWLWLMELLQHYMDILKTIGNNVA